MTYQTYAEAPACKAKTKENEKKIKVRKLLSSMINRLEKQMSLGVFPGNMARLSGISFMRNRMAFLENTNLEAHYRLVVSQETMIRELMPNEETRFQTFRLEILQLIIDAKNFFEVPALKTRHYA